MSGTRSELAALRRERLSLEAGLASAREVVSSVEASLRAVSARVAVLEAEAAGGPSPVVVLECWEEWAREVAVAMGDPEDARVLVFAPGGVVAGQASTPGSRAGSRGGMFRDGPVG